MDKLFGSRSKDYQLVDDASNPEPDYNYTHGKNKLVLKLCRQIRFLIICCAFLCAILLVIVSVPFSKGSPWASRSSSMGSQQGLGIDSLLFAPEAPLVTQIYDYRGPTITEITPTLEKTWEKDMPRGGGFVQIPDTLDIHGGNVWAVSVFHQLHCLQGMQHSYARALKDASQIPRSEIMHTYHCGALIRQALKCAADPTLDETHLQPRSPTGRETDGWNGTHVCRDFARLRDWTEENRASDHA